MVLTPYSDDARKNVHVLWSKQYLELCKEFLATSNVIAKLAVSTRQLDPNATQSPLQIKDWYDKQEDFDILFDRILEDIKSIDPQISIPGQINVVPGVLACKQLDSINRAG